MRVKERIEFSPDDYLMVSAVTATASPDVVEVTDDLEDLYVVMEESKSAEAEDSYRNNELSNRIQPILKDVVEKQVTQEGEGKASNKLVDDLFKPLGAELNEVNGYDKGFTIDEDE